MKKNPFQKFELFFLLSLIFGASASMALAPASIDTDRDGVEDSVDLDDDGDGIFDSLDAFPTNPRYTQDSDSDGMPDSWEPLYGLNPNDAGDASSDSDEDGLSANEEFNANTSPNLKDSDRDTLSDKWEIVNFCRKWAPNLIPPIALFYTLDPTMPEKSPMVALESPRDPKSGPKSQ